ncbi:MAG TPA: nitrilase-related carbon-nitrogen hydrolase [Phycisphaerae bacterium]|nr:nitrilase-related carbon-nitrogen hydrolase [Phycisphaerae bacterium]HNU45025.1 nitrilase-related carbon-nitrogen hydrolase [Phycisphaerae bacterium]
MFDPAAPRYWAAACQTDFPCPADRSEIGTRANRMLQTVERIVAGYAAFGCVKLLAFPEFAHAAPIYEDVATLRRRLAIPIPNEHTERYQQKARELDVYIQIGTFLEADARWPDAVFNTTCLIGPGGILSRYRKVHPWTPWELHASPADLDGYADPLFPVADTPIGRLGVTVCYDWPFPEAVRQIAANGAEVIVRVSGLPHRPARHHLTVCDSVLPSSRGLAPVDAERQGRPALRCFHGHAATGMPKPGWHAQVRVACPSPGGMPKPGWHAQARVACPSPRQAGAGMPCGGRLVDAAQAWRRCAWPCHPTAGSAWPDHPAESGAAPP